MYRQLRWPVGVTFLTAWSLSAWRRLRQAGPRSCLTTHLPPLSSEPWVSSSRSSQTAGEAASGAAAPDNPAHTDLPATPTEPTAPAPRWAGTWPMRFPKPPSPSTAAGTASANTYRQSREDSEPMAADRPLAEPGTTSATPASEAPTAPPGSDTQALTGPATLHEARSALPQLIRAATEGRPTPLTRGPYHALLTTPAQATELGWDLTQAEMHGIVDARKRLGDLIEHAAEGHPQVLRRHSTPAAVLLPAAEDATPIPAAPAPTPDIAPRAAAMIPDSATPPEGKQAAQGTDPAAVTTEAAQDPVPATASPAPTTAPTTESAAVTATSPEPQQPEPAPAVTPTLPTAPASPSTTPTASAPTTTSTTMATSPPTDAAPTPPVPAVLGTTPSDPSSQHPSPPPPVLPVTPAAPPAATAVTTVASHETAPPATSPPTTTPRTSRRLAVLAHALDTVLPTTTPTDETATPTP
ncbi:type II toxin-antitoxin system prevent-host-death family antitoxin [Streptomyces anulatus]|uniref:type II toxin-antitoxin system prevent-host-death family antitoxin n=1 Tax=Streptomyces anulatus TaxID=1892 RepID=UPI003864401E